MTQNSFLCKGKLILPDVYIVIDIFIYITRTHIHIVTTSNGTSNKSIVYK